MFASLAPWLGPILAVLAIAAASGCGFQAQRTLARRFRKQRGASSFQAAAHFRAFPDSLPQLAWMAASNGERFLYNRRWRDFTGIGHAEIAGFDWQSQLHPEDLTDFLDAWKASIGSGHPLSIESRLRGHDGFYRWFLTLATPARDPEGRVTAWCGIDTDITELRQFRQMVDSAPHLHLVAGPEGDVVWSNQRWLTFSAYPPEELLGRGWLTLVHPDDQPRLSQKWRDSLASGAPFETEIRLRRQDQAFRWFLVRFIPVDDPNGRIAKWFGVCTEFHDFKEAQAQTRGLTEDLEARVAERTAELARTSEILAETESRLNAILDAASSVSIIATDPVGVITVFNRGAERMLLYSAAEVIGRVSPLQFHLASELEDIATVLSGEWKRPVRGFDVLAEPARLGLANETDWTYVRKDGVQQRVNLAWQAVRNPAGIITGYLGIASNITARKEMEHDLRENNVQLVRQTARAEEANLAKSAFLAAMSHEIRTPMNAILGMSDLLWESPLDSEQRQYVQVFRRAGNVLLDLINSVLDLSKIESGHLELECALFDLEDVVTRTIELLSPKALAKGVLLLYRIAPEVQTKLLGDAFRLQQILVNLVGNAVKFTESGEVVLHIQLDISGALEVAVHDTGIGISPEQIKSVFDDFNQADTSITRRFGGTGLGLGIAQRLIRCMGGQLSVTSQLGAGSVFRFSAVLKPGVDRRPTESDELKYLKGLRILVIDNNETNRLILRETLSFWGLTSVECSSAEAGSEEIARGRRECQPYALVLLDRHMPHTDGFAAIPLLRQAEPRIPIVMLTSDSRSGDQAKHRGCGLSGYAVKPIKRADLLHLICNALSTPSHKPSEDADSAAPERIAPPISRPLRILIAEDSPDNRLLLGAYLRTGPFQLTFTENGKEALARFQSEAFDVVLMDLQMPVMDGLTAARAFRAYESAQGVEPTPIIALTANALAEDAATSYRAGCNAHLSKPISKGKLLSAIEQYGYPRALAPAPSTIWVDAPEGLERFVPDYLKTRKEELPQLLQLLAASDFESLRGKAHDLKGSGGSFGFLELTRIGAELERLAKSRDSDSLALQLQELQRYLSCVRIAPVAA